MTGNKSNGFYTDPNGDRRIPVTSIIRVLDKSDALVPWAAGEVWTAMVKDPSITIEQARKIPWEARDKAASRGSTVHSLIELYKTSQGLVDSVPEQYRGYYQAFKSWVEKNKPTWVFQEKTLYHPTLPIAGTCDGVVEINGKRFIVDFKTNKEGQVYPETELQMSAYMEMALKSQISVDGILGVGLSEKGSFKEFQFMDEWETFMHCYRIYRWKNKELLTKLGI